MESSFGMWWDPTEPDNKVAGQLTWEPLKAPVLSLLDPPLRMWAGADLAAGVARSLGGETVPMIHGTLANRGEVTLLGCHWGGMKLQPKTATYRLRVSQALPGIWLDEPDEAFIRRVEVELPALAALLGEFPIRADKLATGRGRKVQLALDHRTHSWKSGEVEAMWRYNWTTTIGRTSSTVTMRPTVDLTSSRPKPLDYWVEQWLVPMNLLLTTVTGTRSNPAQINVWKRKHLTRDVRATLRIPVWAQGVGQHDHASKRQRLLLRADAIDRNPGGLHSVLERVRDLGREQEVFLDLLIATINYSDRPVRNLYLDLTSALEAFHSQRYGLSSMSVDTFKQQRKDAIDAIADSGVANAHRKFVKRWLPGRPSRSLEVRLQRLARDVGVLESWTISPLEMASLRNDVAHGNTGLDYRALDAAHEQAFDLSRRLVLHELGIHEPKKSGPTSDLSS